MEKELQDPKIFVVLNDNQKETFEANLPELDKTLDKKTPTKNLKKEIESFKQISKEKHKKS